MNGFEKIMEHFAETKYKSRIEKREKLVSEDVAEEMYEYLLWFSNWLLELVELVFIDRKIIWKPRVDQHIREHTKKLAKKRGKKVTIPARPDPDMPEHMIPEHDDWKIPIVEEMFW